MSAVHLRISLCGLLLLPGCVLAPKGLDDERKALDHEGQAWSKPFEERTLPEIPDHPGTRDLLERAFLANGELEASYFEWKAALEDVSIAAGWPNTNLAPSFSYMVSGSQAKAWDRTTVNIAFDPMQNLSLPSKVRKAGELALENARETGSRFAAAKFSLQRRVLESWLKLALLEERARIQQERVRLAKIGLGIAGERAALKGEQRDLLRAQVEERTAELDLSGLETETRAARVQLNGLLAREPDAPLELPASLPGPRPLPVDDATLIRAGVDNNPELRALGFATSGREDALELARLQYLPDFNPFVAFTGSIEQTIGVGVSLPTRLPQLRAGVEQARAMLRGAQATLRQVRRDRLSSFVADLYVLRYSERQAAFLAENVLPAARQALESAQQAHATGATSFRDLIEAQDALLDVRLSIAEARIEREQRLAEIEELTGLDVETLVHAGEQPTAALEHPQEDGHE